MNQRKKLTVFIAGSLTVPFGQIVKVFEKANPEFEVRLEAAGSQTCARWIIEEHKPCDVIALADYQIIDDFLKPEYISWNIQFTSNEMVILYRKDSRYSDHINIQNWPETLLRNNVCFGYTNPNKDPCGYRTLLMWKLAEKYYKIPLLYNSLNLRCQNSHVFDGEKAALLAFNERRLDYLFLYRSVAAQRDILHLLLPQNINLSSPEYNQFYSQVSIRIAGKKPDSLITINGKAMIYGISALTNSLNYDKALEFIRLVVGPQGQKILKENGQEPLVSPLTMDFARLPVSLKAFVKEVNLTTGRP